MTFYVSPLIKLIYIHFQEKNDILYQIDDFKEKT